MDISFVDDASTDDLVTRWMAGDADAAAALYERYRERAFRFGMALTRRELDADEISHEALTAGLEVLRGGKRPDHFTGWVLGIVKNLARHRRDRPAPLGKEDLSADPRAARPSRALVESEMASVLASALDALPAADRALLERRLAADYRRDRLAVELGVSVDTLDRRLARILREVRSHLSGHFTTLVLAPPAPSMAKVGALRPSFKQAFLLRHVEELPEEECAARLEIDVATLRERLKYAYAKLGCNAATDFRPLRRR